MSCIKKIFVTTTVEGALSPLSFFINYSGTNPFRVVKQGSQLKTVISIPWLIILIILASIYVLSVAFVTLTEETIVGLFYGSIFLVITDWLRVILGFFSVVFFFVIIFTQKDSFRSKLVFLTEIDGVFAEMGVTKNYTKQRLFHIFNMILVYIVDIGYVTISMQLKSHENTELTLPMIIATNTPTHIVTLTVVLFVSITRMAWKNLLDLNKQITLKFHKYLKENDEQKSIMLGFQHMHEAMNDNRDVKRSENIKNLKIIMKTYDKICDLTDSLSECFATQIFIILIFAFLFIVIKIFIIMNIFTWLIDHASNLKSILYYLLFCVYHCTIHIVNVYKIASICTDCETQAKKTAILINKIMIQCTDDEELKMLQVFSTYLIHRRPEFSAGGFFSIRNSLVISMAGAITTYSIILIEFSVSPLTYSD